MQSVDAAAGGPRVLHAWGQAACGPDGDAGLIDGFGASPDVVVTPSYWGGRRRELHSGELVRRGFDPRIGDLATELMGLERPTVGHSFLIEVEVGRICVSRLDFDSGLADSRLSFRGGDATEVIGDVVGALLSDAAVGEAGAAAPWVAGTMPGPVDFDDVEFIVADEDDRLVADMRRRGWLAFPVPVHALGVAGAGGGRGAGAADPEFDAARWPGEDRDKRRDEGWDEGRDEERAHGSGDVEAGAGAGRAEERAGDGLDVAALRRKARSIAHRPRGRGLAKSAPALAAALVVGVAVAAIVLIVDGPVGEAWREEAELAAAVDGREAVDGPPGGPGLPTEDPARSHVDPVAPGAPDTSAAPVAPVAPKDDGPAARELVGEGVRVELPERWRIDDGAASASGSLVVVDGGPMRILVTAGAVPAEMGADGLVAGLTAHAAAEPSMDRVRREVIDGLEVVIHEERPGDGSVVLWQHRLVDGWQVSVGCQFRGATIPQVRPVCGQALRTAGIVHR
ncbi:type VII secretion-associated protein [Corynebacterium xerosis]|uniref:Type VII secretion-associated protein n=1 Tax=Corynebacterium xerosis TaxID=1725 RepID=A0A6B8TQ01_9CORY|nr:type VII secretion-associated protein [Corynebacterium xerosis]QGS34821.1 type VII secretion-associated protein [Corynebacterium xerosis]